MKERVKKSRFLLTSRRLGVSRNIEKFPRKPHRVPPLVAPSAVLSTAFPLHALSFRTRRITVFFGGCVRDARTAFRENVVSRFSDRNGSPRSAGDQLIGTGESGLFTNTVAHLTSNLSHITCPILTWHVHVIGAAMGETLNANV